MLGYLCICLFATVFPKLHLLYAWFKDIAIFVPVVKPDSFKQETIIIAVSVSVLLISAIFGIVCLRRYRIQGKSFLFFAILVSSRYDYTKADANVRQG